MPEDLRWSWGGEARAGERPQTQMKTFWKVLSTLEKLPLSFLFDPQ